MRIHQHDEILVGDELAAFVNFVDRRAGEENPESFRVLLIPLLVGHLAAIGTQPENVFDADAFDGASLKEIAPAEDGMVLAERDDFARETDEFLFSAELLPIDPADFVTGQKHRNTLGKN